MRPLERAIEQYLCDRVKATGGETRKVAWPGHRGGPDRVCFWPNGRHPFVEVKRPGEKPRPEQVREHEKLRKGGFDVWVLDNKAAIDIFIDQMIH